MTGSFTPPGGPQAQGPAWSPPTPPPASHAADERSARTSSTTSVRKAGRGMMLAAWIAIAAGVALLIGISWSVALDVQGGSLEPAAASETGDLHAMQVVPGMCLERIGEDGSVSDATVVDCDEPHTGEVITALGFSELRFPGDADVAQRTRDHCATRMPDLGDGSSWVAWVPTAESWQRGDTVALCIATWEAPREGRVGPDRSSVGEDADQRDDAEPQAA
ncbi:septum formation family protein [Demequina activiva]|uniref:Septum formation-related domain-containing protein n=1 Tax=Demequina activiva TaxID=1582364 RepID=A0A919UJ48_9MICO|nr:septum formation family protein [Demequina activiva]GIG54011.1 hypothetical protein Dac01nite_07630 [Demequina activiva]